MKQTALEYYFQKKIDFHVLQAIDEAIKKQNINLVLKLANKEIGTSSVYMTNETKGYVYFLTKKNKVVYIGQSYCKGRVGWHQGKKDFDCVYSICFKENIYEYVEHLLIKNFKTKYNCCQIARKYHEQD